jgi:hypothetical protein
MQILKKIFIKIGQSLCSKHKKCKVLAQWLIHLILAILEIEIGMSMIRGQPGQKVHGNSFQTNSVVNLGKKGLETPNSM